MHKSFLKKVNNINASTQPMVVKHRPFSSVSQDQTLEVNTKTPFRKVKIIKYCNGSFTHSVHHHSFNLCDISHMDFLDLAISCFFGPVRI